jgi:hypothetical protein
MSAHDEYKALDTPVGQHIAACPVCGAAGALWQYSKSEQDATTKAVMCTNGEAIGPQDGVVNEGCLLYLPPRGFYQATIREAIKYWNEYAKALMRTTDKAKAENWAAAVGVRVVRRATGVPHGS